MANFPKPVDTRPQLVLPSKAALLSQFDARELALRTRHEELLDFEKQLQEEQERLQINLQELEERSRALVEGELLLKNHRLLQQNSSARLMDQTELFALRADLEQQIQDISKKEAFHTQTETRLSEQFSARDADLRKREAWVSTEHEKAALHNTRRLQAIVFTDVVSFSALMQANEGLTIQKVRTDLQRMQAEGKAQGGALINTMGDGMLMIFSSATQAVRFSLQMQRSFNLNSGAGGLRHRFGIHIADVALLPDGGIAGDGVNIASRLESQAPPGGVCLSAVVYAVVKGKLALPPTNAEEIRLKNISDPVAVHQYTPEAILAASEVNEIPSPEIPPA